MKNFLEQSRQTQEQKRSGRGEKDPADLSGAQEPNWDDPSSWGNDPEEPASDPASGNPDESPAGTDAENEGEKPEPVTPASPKGPSPSSTRPSRAPRRRGRPRGPARVPLTVRILEQTDRKLTAAVDQTGLNPQTLVEDALEAYFRRLKIQDPGPETDSEGAA
ncbi:hypothetical protein [Streptomyces rochei]|uniref:hypothetical protein n=1 Tax=Streptomyces rochei TaxID=1928 RepID=UPI0036AB9189